ncbi:unnamed protein product, partial [Ectocarpus fasciculatus]
GGASGERPGAREDGAPTSSHTSQAPRGETLRCHQSRRAIGNGGRRRTETTGLQF